MAQKFNCIIVDPELSSRMRLKQATTPVPEFGSVIPVGSFHEAQNYLGGERQLDVIFVSGRLPQPEVSSFITNGRQSKQGCDSAYVIVRKSKEEGNKDIAETMILGGDGVLCEPYSVDSLLEITMLAARVRKERADARERIAMQLLVKEMISQIDLVACLKANGCELGLSIKKLREMGETIRSISSPEAQQFYFDAMEKGFIDAPLPPKALAVKKYGGVSNRVKKKMEAKIAEDLQKQAKTE